MLDLETLGVSSKAAIVSIGAVKFDPRAAAGTIIAQFKCNVDLQSAIDAGGMVDGLTAMWWIEQGQAAREALKTPEPVPLAQALSKFNEFVGGDRPLVWGNGAAFDCVVLRNAYRAFGEYPPFGFRDEMCYRTLRTQLPEIEYERLGAAHDALDDAVSQAVHLQKLFNKFMPKEG